MRYSDFNGPPCRRYTQRKQEWILKTLAPNLFATRLVCTFTQSSLQAYINFTTLHCCGIVYLQHSSGRLTIVERLTSQSPLVYGGESWRFILIQYRCSWRRILFCTQRPKQQTVQPHTNYQQLASDALSAEFFLYRINADRTSRPWQQQSFTSSHYRRFCGMEVKAVCTKSNPITNVCGLYLYVPVAPTPYGTVATCPSPFLQMAGHVRHREQQTRNWRNCTDHHESADQNDYCTCGA